MFNNLQDYNVGTLFVALKGIEKGQVLITTLVAETTRDKDHDDEGVAQNTFRRDLRRFDYCAEMWS